MVTDSPGALWARRTSAAPWAAPRPTTGSASPESPGMAGKLAPPSSSQSATARAPAEAARATTSAIGAPPRATTTTEPATRLSPSAVRNWASSVPAETPASSRSTTTGSAPDAGSGPSRGSGPRRAAAGPRRASRSAVRAASGADAPPTAITVGRAARPPTDPGRENVGPSLPAGATTVAPTRSASDAAAATGSVPAASRPAESPIRITFAVSEGSPSPLGSTARSSAARTRSLRARGRSRPPTASGAITR